jgi:hypothetical protein
VDKSEDPRLVVQEGVVVDTLPLETIEAMVEKTITLIKYCKHLLQTIA